MAAPIIVYTMPLRRVSRHLVKRAGTLNMGTYATSGIAFAPVAGKTILKMNIEDSTLNFFQYDYTNSLVLAYVKTTGAQVADTTDLSAVVVNWASLGKK